MAIVLGAAYWRHRDTTAVAFGIAGIGVGVLVVALAGQAYLGLITSVVSLPPIDPQGAVAFMPAFQTALYFALVTAAYVDVGWKRVAVGLAALIGAQVAVLFALNAILNNSGMTMAVRDVRAWALAGPVLVFAAVVSLGRPRR